MYIGSVTARHSASGHQPNFAALNRGCHLYLAGHPSRWALAYILVIISLNGALLTENKNKALQSGDAGGQHFGVRAPGGVAGQVGAVQSVAGADPINALQNLTKQPVPANMTQPGALSFVFCSRSLLSARSHTHTHTSV